MSKPESPQCRRCSECVGCEHHWIDFYDDRKAPGITHLCKHCPAAGFACEVCGGEGDETCPACRGYAVTLIGTVPESIHDDDECGKPCSFNLSCDECRSYWARMVDEGLFDPVRLLWTDKAITEAARF